MSQMSRHEIVELLKKFQERFIPNRAQMAPDHPVLEGVKTIEAKLDANEGIPDLTLRGYARLMKHYLEAPKDDHLPYHFMFAMQLFATNGGDVTKAVKRARVEFARRYTPFYPGESTPASDVAKADRILAALSNEGGHAPVREVAVNNQI